ncbi:MAG: hypothetical protein H0V92_11435 [Pseudonocardiales bacterium]|nr:hypothetical protein [Pseudonocardiales bacterium]
MLVHSEHQARAYRLRCVEPTANPLRIDPATLDRLIPPDDVISVVHALLSAPLASERE